MKFTLRAIKAGSVQAELIVTPIGDGNVRLQSAVRRGDEVVGDSFCDLSARGAFDLADALSKCGAYSESASYVPDARDEEIAKLRAEVAAQKEATMQVHRQVMQYVAAVQKEEDVRRRLASSDLSREHFRSPFDNIA